VIRVKYFTSVVGDEYEPTEISRDDAIFALRESYASPCLAIDASTQERPAKTTLANYWREQCTGSLAS
jgi:hypothetical protein